MASDWSAASRPTSPSAWTSGVGLVGVGGRLLVEPVAQREARVVDLEVDVALLERGEQLIAGADRLLDVDGEALRLEVLAVHLGERLLLAPVLGADADRGVGDVGCVLAAVGGAIACWAIARAAVVAAGRQRQHADHGEHQQQEPHGGLAV
ncbi:MAG: hypothetical protein R2701_04475 [Acidimicrobiales bacterium]